MIHPLQCIAGTLTNGGKQCDLNWYRQRLRTLSLLLVVLQEAYASEVYYRSNAKDEGETYHCYCCKAQP